MKMIVCMLVLTLGAGALYGCAECGVSDRAAGPSAAAAGTQAAEEGEPGGEVVRGTGTIKFISIEGGYYGIEADDGSRFDPINLPKEFKIDGQRVNFAVKKRPDMVGVHMRGDIVEVLEMQKLAK